MTRVLVIGGAGVFGAHLARALAEQGLEVVIAGRSLSRAVAMAETLPGALAVALDRGRLTAAELRATGAGVVVDAAGPFQGTEPVVARAAPAAGRHYVDLADARDFVARFPELDAAARAAGVVMLTGASSTPALSHAALDHLTEGWRRIDAVEAVICPGARAPRGRGVMAALLSWMGAPVRVFEDGRWRTRRGWSGLHRRAMGAAGHRWASLCETPDLDLMVERHRPTRSALFLAGLEPPVLHFAAWLLAAVSGAVGVRFTGAARVLAAPARPLGMFGDDRGAMRVEARGLDAEGRPVTAVWVLNAPSGVGPVPPALPAAAAVQAVLSGRAEPGARPCVGLLTLEDMAPLLNRHGLSTHVAVTPGALFERVLGEDFRRLPEPIRDLHRTLGDSVWSGRASVQGARSWAGRLTAALFGFPGEHPETPVTVRITSDGRRSVWRRRIGSGRFRSVLTEREGGVVERFGLLAFDLDLTVADGRLAYSVRGWRLGPVPLPRALAPVTTTHEAVDAEGRFTFDVEISAPLVGRLVRYRGRLTRAV